MRICDGGGAREQRAESWLKYAARASHRQPAAAFSDKPAANQRPAGLRRGASTNRRPVLQRLQCAQPAPGQGGGAGRPFTPAGAGVGGMVQLSWRVECRVLHSGACHNTLCPSCHTRPRPPARTSCAQSPGPRLQHSGPGPHCPQVRDGECCCPPTAAVYQSLGEASKSCDVSRVTCHDNSALSISAQPRPDNPH